MVWQQQPLSTTQSADMKCGLLKRKRVLIYNLIILYGIVFAIVHNARMIYSLLYLVEGKSERLKYYNPLTHKINI